MQPLRYVCISAHGDGSVNSAEIGWGNDGEKDQVVLPLPLWTDVDVWDLVDCFRFERGRYWLDSYATLLGIQLDTNATFEDLWVKVMERNERFRFSQGTRELPFDQERF